MPENLVECEVFLRASEMLRYDHETGYLYWLPIAAPITHAHRVYNTRFAGKRAGSRSATNGYRTVCIQWEAYKEHRLIWLLVTGGWPRTGLDHVNGVKDDNRFDNLREADQSENGQNIAAPCTNTSGFIGVSPSKGKWAATITLKGKKYHLGYFNTPEEASQAYLSKKAEIHQFQPQPRRFA